MINFRYIFAKSILCQSFAIGAKDRLKTTHFQFVGNVRAAANGVELSWVSWITVKLVDFANLEKFLGKQRIRLVLAGFQNHSCEQHLLIKRRI